LVVGVFTSATVVAAAASTVDDVGRGPRPSSLLSSSYSLPTLDRVVVVVHAAVL
jgi:hypothetical protein